MQTFVPSHPRLPKEPSGWWVTCHPRSPAPVPKGHPTLPERRGVFLSPVHGLPKAFPSKRRFLAVPSFPRAAKPHRAPGDTKSQPAAPGSTVFPQQKPQPKHAKAIYFPLSLQVFIFQAQNLPHPQKKQLPALGSPVPALPAAPTFVPGEPPRTNHNSGWFPPRLPHLTRPQRFNPPQGGEEEEESRMASAQMRCATFEKSRSLTCEETCFFGEPGQAPNLSARSLEQ